MYEMGSKRWKGMQFCPHHASHFCLGTVEKLHLPFQKGMALFVHAPNETDKHILMYAEALLRIRRCKHCIGILSIPQYPTMIHRDPTVPRAVRSRNRIGMLEYPLAWGRTPLLGPQNNAPCNHWKPFGKL